MLYKILKQTYRLFKARNYLLFKIIIGITLFLSVYTRIGFSNVFEKLLTVNIIFLIGYIMLKFFSLFFNALNLYIMLIPSKVKLKLREVWKYASISWAFGLLVPGKIGEFSLVYLLKKKKIDYGEGLAISMLDKILTFITLFSFGLLGLLLFLPNIIIYVSIIFTIIILSIIYFIYKDSYIDKILIFILKNKIKHIRKFKEVTKLYIKKHYNLIILNLIVTALKWGLTAFTISILFMGFGIYIPFYKVLFIQSIITIISLIPITISGLGVAEPTGIFLYGLIGIPQSISASMFLIALFVTYLLGGLILLFYFNKRI